MFTFKEEERLKSKKIIDSLFLGEKGKDAFSYPLKVRYICEQTEVPSLPQIAVTIPKKKFKSSVDRNKLKRQIKEAYRLNNSKFKTNALNSSTVYYIMFVYIASEKEPYEKIQKSMIKILKSFK